MVKKSLFCVLFFLLASCNDSTTADAVSEPNAAPQDEISAGTAAVPEEPEGVDPDPSEPAMSSLHELADELGIPALSMPWTGDLDGMRERRVIRVLTVYGLPRYYLDGGREMGLTYEAFKLFEQSVNKRFGTKTLKIHVVFIPVARHELIQGLIDGRGDIAAAGLTITPERRELIDFTQPASRDLSEVLVTGPSAPPLETINDLAGREIFVRPSSSYLSSVDTLNEWFREDGLEEIRVRDASEYLEDEDLLEMVSAGLLDWAIVDSYKAEVWKDLFPNLTVRDDIEFRFGGRLGWAIRKDSPQLMQALNEFLKSHRQGTLKGNVLINRYIRDFDWAGNALAVDDFSRFQHLIDIFKTYGDRYEVDFLIAAAQGYQESRLDQNARSRAGAIGIMQLLPSTAADKNVGIPDISKVDPNIHAGMKYLDFIRNRYFSDPEIDDFNRTLFALAAYNAGPARITQLRSRAAGQGYDPNKWFDNVEVLAAKQVGREPVIYVSNILKYYVAYRMIVERGGQRAQERDRQGLGTDS
jgi:membrane-bound lytic murein transglycosylase MltF